MNNDYQNNKETDMPQENSFSSGMQEESASQAEPSEYNNKVNSSNGGYEYQPSTQHTFNGYRENEERYSYSEVDNSSIKFENAKSKNKSKNFASKGFVVAIISLGMVFSLAIGLVVGSTLNKNGSSGMISGGNVQIVYAESTEDEPVTDKGDAAYVASKVANTVVEVSTETVSTHSYFGQYVTQGAGSGVIISSGEQGSYIITCAHVINGATRITVTLKDGTSYEASLIKGDSQTDIGIIKIDVSGLDVATVADFSKTVVGEGVVAIGNPLGQLGGSVTNGIVSALDRDIIIDGTTYNLLQTNAEINPGNSGGGLFNMEGELIGIVNAKSSNEEVEGLGFAIPIDEAIKVATQLIESGYVKGRVQLGFKLIEINESNANQIISQYLMYSRYFTDYGIYIMESESSDFKLGDRIVALDKIKPKSISDLKSMLTEYEVGETVTVTVSRLNSKGQDEIIDINLVLTELSETN